MSPPVLLCVDDQPELLRIRKAALAVLEGTPVAAVLIEYKSEGMDTEAVAWHIKRRFPAKPVILLSAYADLPERVLWLVDDYLMRSEPMELVLQLVQRMVRRAGQAPAA